MHRFITRRLYLIQSTAQKTITMTAEKPSTKPSTTTEVLPSAHQQQQHMPSEKLKNGIPLMINNELHWQPKYFESRTKKSAIEEVDDDLDNLLRHLPPPPKYNLNPLIPEHAQKQKELLELMDKHLPPYDILRIPVWTNRPWFDYALYSYLALVSLCVILFGKWDDLNEGEEHVFSGIRRVVFGWWAKYTHVDEDRVKEEFEKLSSSSSKPSI